MRNVVERNPGVMDDEILYLDEDRPGRPGMSRATRRLSAGVLIIGVVAAAVLMYFRFAAGIEELKRCRGCEENLRQLALAMEKYERMHGVFPPAVTHDDKGKPMHSWRALILPFLSETKEYAERYRYDEPWDGPHNKGLLAKAPSVFVCPNHASLAAKGRTSYVGIIGEHAFFSPNWKGRTVNSISDGTNDTVMLVETASLDVPWLAPRDLEWGTMSWIYNDKTKPSISSTDSEGPHAARVNALTATLHTKKPPEYLKAICTIDGGEPADPF